MSQAVPEIEFYRTELARALKELEFGINRYSLPRAQADEPHDPRIHGTAGTTMDTADWGPQYAETVKGRAIAMIQVLEGKQVFVECVNDGFRTVNLPSGTINPSLFKDAPKRETYDTLDSLLLNLSPGFMKQVNERLETKLWSVFAERQVSEAQETED
ncbi:hypothetical protein QFC22_000159 [Naganishia vaughanmartiniae]|uniref:Uncharacterized protein n=1 Tax=Naganishia vaughanmartiniae TaxID=1424756 RepID=A0ACC2XPB6_9TREE|nr:hypothetical protein QFC22_000159 [Naganishia vaughanmartiniae]